MSNPSCETWAAEPPREDGWYWWRMGPGYPAAIRHVRNGVTRFTWGTNDETYDAVDNVGGEWQAVVPPKEATT